MKSVFNFILTACVIGIIYLCYSAIMRPVNFNNAKAMRDHVVEQRLKLIRAVEIEYGKKHGGAYCGNWTELIQFAKTCKLPRLKKNKKTDSIPDTTWVALTDSLFPERYAIDSLKYVPFVQNIPFELTAKVDSIKWKTTVYLLRVQTPYSVYLTGLDNNEIQQLEKIVKNLGKYGGLRIGDLDTPNYLAGNWE